MPDVHGFDHLPNRGSIRLRCIWCGWVKRPSTPERALAQHARVHRKDVERAKAESSRERQTASIAISL